MVEGNSGVFGYGGLKPAVGIGDTVRAAEHLGQILTMVRFAAGRPTSLLHLELHAHGVRQAAEWLDVNHRRRPCSIRRRCCSPWQVQTLTGHALPALWILQLIVVYRIEMREA